MVLNKKKNSALLESIASKKTASVTETEATSNIISLNKIFDLKICTDKEVNDYLNKKGFELYSNEINTNLKAGEIFTEVFEKLSGSNQYDGLYNKWLYEMGYNPRTALRHRIRYSFFRSVTDKKGKELFATLPIRLLDKLHVHSEREHIISLINSSDIDSKETLKSFMESDDLKEINEKKKTVTTFYKPVFAFEKKIEKMTTQESLKALDELKKIKKEVSRLEKILLNKNENKINDIDENLTPEEKQLKDADINI